MKKLLVSLLALGLVLTGCSSKPKDKENSTYEVALITDFGDVDDKSFNQGCWEGIQDYAKENNVSHTYYKPVDESAKSYLDAIDEAINNGAKIVVTPGFAWATAIYEAQDKYPDVKFVLIDDKPHSEDYSTYKTADNTVSIMYLEQQAGFLAGYAVVKAGYTKLGFMGGMKTDAVIRYGYGFVAGAEYAARELGISGIECKYHYTGIFDATPEAQTLASTWYRNGTEVIFGCGGALGNSVFAAAQTENGKAVGVDVDQSSQSETIITSAMKSIRLSVHDVIKAFYEDAFPGGEDLVYGAEVGYVALPEDFSKLNGFTKEDYDAVYEKLKSGEIVPYDVASAEFAHDLSNDIIKVDANGLTD